MKKQPSAAPAYKPPYTVSEQAISLIADIAAAAERYRILLEGPDGVLLRKINHIRTIRGTTAIEGNTLTEEQVTAILDGKPVAAPRREIEEIRGAHAAYSLLGKIDPFSVKDALKVHKAMMQGLVEAPGALRSRGVGVVDGLGNVIHMAPPADRVPMLLSDLFAWVKTSPAHPLVKSSVFHYEFEFIHPFLDGNGRMGRFLQTAMLGAWNPLFHAAPIENIVFENQAEYYRAINRSTAAADSGPFIDFMLERILATIRAKGVPIDKSEEEKTNQKTDQKTTQKTNQKTDQKTSQKILAALRKTPNCSLAQLAAATGLSVSGVKWQIRALKSAGRIRRVGPDKGGHWEVLK